MTKPPKYFIASYTDTATGAKRFQPHWQGQPVSVPKASYAEAYAVLARYTSSADTVAHWDGDAGEFAAPKNRAGELMG